MKTQPILASLFLAATLSACDESDAVAVRLQLKSDFSGTLTVSALERVAADAPPVLQTGGTTWKSRVNVRCATGDFTRVQELTISDLVVSGGQGENGPCFLSVTLPRGENVHWARELVPLSAAERKSASAAFDASGNVDEVGATIKFEVTLPNEIVSSGISGRTRGTRAKGEGKIATLVVPVETALSAGEPIVWHITWQK